MFERERREGGREKELKRTREREGKGETERWGGRVCERGTGGREREKAEESEKVYVL